MLIRIIIIISSEVANLVIKFSYTILSPVFSTIFLGKNFLTYSLSVIFFIFRRRRKMNSKVIFLSFLVKHVIGYLAIPILLWWLRDFLGFNMFDSQTNNIVWFCPHNDGMGPLLSISLKPCSIFHGIIDNNFKKYLVVNQFDILFNMVRTFLHKISLKLWNLDYYTHNCDYYNDKN